MGTSDAIVYLGERSLQLARHNKDLYICFIDYYAPAPNTRGIKR